MGPRIRSLRSEPAGSSSNQTKIKIPKKGILILVALVGLYNSHTKSIQSHAFLVILLGPFHFAGATFRTFGSLGTMCLRGIPDNSPALCLAHLLIVFVSDTGKNKNPHLGICISGGPGRTRTDTPCRT